MKKTLLLLFTFLTIYTGYSQCPVADGDGEVVLATQNDIDNFTTNYPGCTSITGKLVIGNKDFNLNTDIVDLTPLSGITSISNGLDLRSNHALTSLSGLSNLNSISTSLSLYWNTVLTDLDGLQQITSLTGLVFMQYNGITSMNGLDNLASIGGEFQFFNNDSFTSFTGLGNLISVTGNVRIQQNLNVGLTDFSGLDKLESIGGYLQIDSNPGIQNMNGLDLLNSIGSNVFITNNINLVSLSDSNLAPFSGGLAALTDIGGVGQGGIQIDDNVLLTDISGIENIPSADISQVTIRRNSELEMCHITNVCSYLSPYTAPYNPGVAIILNNKGTCLTGLSLEAACASLSVSDYLLENAISVYPNPASDQLNIDVISNINIEHVALYSIQGRLIKEQQYQLQTVDLSDVSTGMYLLKIKSDQGDINARIVKQ